MGIIKEGTNVQISPLLCIFLNEPTQKSEFRRLIWTSSFKNITTL